jgi:hypothetical protein
MDTEGSLPHSDKPVPILSQIDPVQVRGHVKCLSFTVRSQYLAEHPQLESHPLSAVRDCSVNVFTATLHIWRQFLYKNKMQHHLIS